MPRGAKHKRTVANLSGQLDLLTEALVEKSAEVTELKRELGDLKRSAVRRWPT